VVIAGTKFVEPSPVSSKHSSVAVSGKSSVADTTTSFAAVVSKSSVTSQKNSSVATSKLDNKFSRDTTTGDVTSQSTVGTIEDETEQQCLQLISTPLYVGSCVRFLVESCDIKRQ